MQPLIGLLSFLFLCANILLCGVAIHLLALIAKLMNRSQAWQRKTFDKCYRLWVGMCSVWFRYVLGMNWQLDDGLKQQPERWHLLVANHQSWVDVFVVLLQVQGRTPPPRIFMKDTLFWLPLVGSATKLMNFPQVKRYSKAKLTKRPELAQKDRRTTVEACKPLMDTPSSIMTFAEGTRFSRKKHAQQDSPYQHLLRPKAGGLWMVLQAMPRRFQEITDFNVVYPDKVPSFWDLLCGRVQNACVITRQVSIPTEFQCMTEQTDKQAFYRWVNAYWQMKDRAMETDLQYCSKLEIKRNGPINEGNSLQN